MKILLLGGAGFIGCSIARNLVEARGNKVTIADNFFRHGGRPDSEVIELQERHGVTLVSGDFTESSAFDALSDTYDMVYMLASVVGVDYVNSMPDEIVRINRSAIEHQGGIHSQRCMEGLSHKRLADGWLQTVRGFVGKAGIGSA